MGAALVGGGAGGGRPFRGVTDRLKELPEKLYCEGGADFPAAPDPWSSGPAAECAKRNPPAPWNEKARASATVAAVAAVSVQSQRHGRFMA